MKKEILQIVRDIGAPGGLPLSMAEEITQAVDAYYKSKVPKKKEIKESCHLNWDSERIENDKNKSYNKAITDFHKEG